MIQSDLTIQAPVAILPAPPFEEQRMRGHFYE